MYLNKVTDVSKMIKKSDPSVPTPSNNVEEDRYILCHLQITMTNTKT